MLNIVNSIKFTGFKFLFGRIHFTCSRNQFSEEFLIYRKYKVSKVHFTVVRSSSAIAKSSVQLLMFLSLTISELSKFFKLFFIYLPLMILHWIFFFWHTKLENQQWTLLFSVKVYLKVRQGDHCYVLHSYHFSTRNCRPIDNNRICHWS